MYQQCTSHCTAKTMADGTLALQIMHEFSFPHFLPGLLSVNLVPRVSPLPAPWSESRETLVGSGHVSLAQGGGKRRDPGTEVGYQFKNAIKYASCRSFSMFQAPREWGKKCGADVENIARELGRNRGAPSLRYFPIPTISEPGTGYSILRQNCPPHTIQLFRERLSEKKCKNAHDNPER